MPDISEKLSKFSSLVLQDAKEKRDELMEHTERDYNERLDKKETELLEGAYESIQKNIQKAHREANERVLHKELEAKKQLITKRDSIIDKVMDSARERLTEFTKSAEYEAWLTDKIKKAFFELGEGAKTVYISPDDIRLADKIKALAENVTVEEASEHGFIGGVKVTNTDRRVAVDYSLGELLSEQKKEFLRESGLALS